MLDSFRLILSSNSESEADFFKCKLIKDKRRVFVSTLKSEFLAVSDYRQFIEMADSRINYKIYNVKCRGNNDSIISLLVLRISHFRGRCESVRSMENTRSGRSE